MLVLTLSRHLECDRNTPPVSRVIDSLQILIMLIMMVMLMFSVARDSSNPLVLKLTLHSLLSRWELDMKLILDDHLTARDGTDDACRLPCTRPSITQLIGADSELSFLSTSC